MSRGGKIENSGTVGGGLAIVDDFPGGEAVQYQKRKGDRVQRAI